MSEFDAFAECFATPHLVAEFGGEKAVVCQAPLNAGEPLVFAAIVGNVASGDEVLDLNRFEQEERVETVTVDLHGDASMVREEWIVGVPALGEEKWEITRLVRGTLTRLELRRRTTKAIAQAGRLKGGARG